MKNKQAFTLKQAITAVKTKGGNAFKLPLILTEMELDQYIKGLEELRKPSEKYNAFLAEKRELLSKYAELDEAGNLMLYAGQNGTGERKYDYGFPNIIKDKEEFEEAAAELEKKYKKVLEAEQKKQLDFEKTLEEEADIELKQIPSDALPELDYDYLKIFVDAGIVEV